MDFQSGLFGLLLLETFRRCNGRGLPNVVPVLCRHGFVAVAEFTLIDDPLAAQWDERNKHENKPESSLVRSQLGLVTTMPANRMAYRPVLFSVVVRSHAVGGDWSVVAGLQQLTRSRSGFWLVAVVDHWLVLFRRGHGSTSYGAGIG